MRIYRIFGIINDLNLLVNIQMQAFVLLILLVTYMYLSHLFCCIYYYIGRMEVGHNNRFDGQTLVHIYIYIYILVRRYTK